MTNAEKQAAWRARQAANKARVAELEAEVARLKAGSPTASDAPTRMFDDIDAKVWKEWFEKRIVDGFAAPSFIDLLGRGLTFMGQAYWGRNGERRSRKPMTHDEQAGVIQRRKDKARAAQR
jgi:hypothetical protein